jgi:hypothetical protein
MGDMFIHSDATLSDCGMFRYALKRIWDHGPMATFIMLNPSTADASEDDPTIRRCISFAKREGCAGIRVENLYGFRATKPDKMFERGNSATGRTDDFIRGAVMSSGGPIIAAWGADPRAKGRADQVIDMVTKMRLEMVCLGKTKSGAPRHPLYVKGDTPLINLV